MFLLYLSAKFLSLLLFYLYLLFCAASLSSSSTSEYVTVSNPSSPVVRVATLVPGFLPRCPVEGVFSGLFASAFLPR
jgi:hypothetical protein